MYAPEPSTERTAFRNAEKKYKLYYDCTKRKKLPRPVDLTEVVDFRSILECFNRAGELPEGVFTVKSEFEGHVFGFESQPGFYFIPGALSVDEQCRWIRESLEDFPQPPNRTNHNAAYGPIWNLFAASKEDSVLVEDEQSPEAPRWKFASESDQSCRGNTAKPVSARALLRKLRWSTLGLQFDWSKRNYNISLPHNKIPDALFCLAKRLAKPAMLPGEEFQAEGAIVNYFAQDDTLGGHLDDMEKDWSKPIVSIRLFSFSEASLEKILLWQCSFEVVMPYLWQEEQGNATMVFLGYSLTSKMLR